MLNSPYIIAKHTSVNFPCYGQIRLSLARGPRSLSEPSECPGVHGVLRVCQGPRSPQSVPRWSPSREMTTTVTRLKQVKTTSLRTVSDCHTVFTNAKQCWTWKRYWLVNTGIDFGENARNNRNNKKNRNLFKLCLTTVRFEYNMKIQQ